MAPSPHIILTERILSLLFFGAIFPFLTFEEMLRMFTVLGHAHFLLTYIYLHRAGRLSTNRIVLLIGFSAILWGTYTLVPHGHSLVLVGSIFFLIHFLCDEVFLFDSEPRLKFLRLCAPILLTLSEATIDRLFETKIFPNLFILSILLTLMNIYLLTKESKKSESLYFILITFFSFYLSLSSVNRFVVAPIVLIHVANWYVDRIHHLWSRKVLLREFLNLVLLSNLFFLGVEYCLRLVAAGAIYKVLFGLLGYTVWAMIHIVPPSGLRI